MFIGVWGDYAGVYLFVLAAVMLVAFGLPMLASPLRWAGYLRWKAPAEPNLALYFGRCLAWVVCAMAGVSFYVALRPELQPIWFVFLATNFAGMVGVHAYGGIKRIQPWTETLEILFWAALLILTLALFP